MAATKGNVQAVVIDEFIFNSTVSEVGFSIAVDELECTNLASTAKEYIPNVDDPTVTVNGYLTGGAADGYEAEMNARKGVSGTNVLYIPLRTTTGSPVRVIPDASLMGLDYASPINGLMTLNGTIRPTDAHYRGMLVTYNTTISGTGNGTSIDLGSAGSAGGYGYLHVHTIDGGKSGTATSASFKIQSSADDSSFADEGTFTVSATGAFSATMSGTVNRYIRLNTADMGGATSFTVTLIACVSGVTY